MFNVDINLGTVKGGLYTITVNGHIVATVDERTANLWRTVSDADQVFVSDDMAIHTDREPLVLVRFRLTQQEMEIFLKAVVYDYDGHTEGPMHMGWDEIDPSLRRVFRHGAETIVESDSWELDKNAHYPIGQPIIIIHPEKKGGTPYDDTPYIELYYVILDEPLPEDE